MKSVSLKLVVIFSIVFTLNLYAGQKRYEIKSGIIQYEVKSTGNVMGFATNAKGKSTLYFKDWGQLELNKDEITQESFGGKEIQKSMTKLEGNILYSVDYDEKVIIKYDINSMKNDQKLLIADKNFLKNNGGKKIGTEKVLGYKCDIWEIHGQKVWIYKGIPLKMSGEMMGIKTEEYATKATFNTTIPSKNFNLPNFPIKNFHEIISEERTEQNENNNNSMMPSQEDMNQFQDQMKNLFKGFGN